MHAQSVIPFKRQGHRCFRCCEFARCFTEFSGCFGQTNSGCYLYLLSQIQILPFVILFKSLKVDGKSRPRSLGCARFSLIKALSYINVQFQFA